MSRYPMDPDFEPRIADWLEADPDLAPAPVLSTVLAAFPSIPQRRASRVPWRFQTMNRFALFGAAAAIVVGGRPRRDGHLVATLNAGYARSHPGPDRRAVQRVGPEPGRDVHVTDLWLLDQDRPDVDGDACHRLRRRPGDGRQRGRTISRSRARTPPSRSAPKPSAPRGSGMARRSSTRPSSTTPPCRTAASPRHPMSGPRRPSATGGTDHDAVQLRGRVRPGRRAGLHLRVGPRHVQRGRAPAVRRLRAAAHDDHVRPDQPRECRPPQQYVQLAPLWRIRSSWIPAGPSPPQRCPSTSPRRPMPPPPTRSTWPGPTRRSGSWRSPSATGRSASTSRISMARS